MTNIEQKALELVNEAARERGYTVQESTRKLSVYVEALCRAIEQHEAFRQEVSDAVEKLINSVGHDDIALGRVTHYLADFILPKPDKQLRSIAADRLVYAASEYFCNRKNNLELIDAIVELAASAVLQETSHDA